jgi:hypothetical protein
MSRKKLLLVIAALLGVFAMLGGCASSSLPPRITQGQRALLEKTHFHLSVGVLPDRYSIYSHNLLKALQETRLFDRVDYVHNFSSPPDINARVHEHIYGSAVLPIYTGLSLGIIPTTVDEEHGFSFELSSPQANLPRVPVRSVHKGPTTLGWWAMALNCLPDRTCQEVKTHPRTIEFLASRIVEQRAAIEALVRK